MPSCPYVCELKRWVCQLFLLVSHLPFHSNPSWMKGKLSFQICLKFPSLHLVPTPTSCLLNPNFFFFLTRQPFVIFVDKVVKSGVLVGCCVLGLPFYHLQNLKIVWVIPLRVCLAQAPGIRVALCTAAGGGLRWVWDTRPACTALRTQPWLLSGACQGPCSLASHTCAHHSDSFYSPVSE
jgi:hypothetical protein